MKPFWVYMLRCSDQSYYVGHTDDLERRIVEHRAGEIPGYTSGRCPVLLVYALEASTRDEALQAEMRLKGWTRRKKEALIRGDWQKVRALSRGRDRLRPSSPARSAGLRSGRTEGRGSSHA